MFKTHVTRVTRSCGPELRIQQRVNDSPIAARTLAEHATPASTAAADVILDVRDKLDNQKICPAPDAHTVDVLIAANTRKTIGQYNHNRRQFSDGNQTVKPFGKIFPEIFPVSMFRAFT